MITYLIHTTSIWVVLFIAYRILLSKEKYFVLNRIYLLASLAIGFLLPLVQLVDFSSQQVVPEVSAMYHQQVQYISQLSASVSTLSTQETFIDWTSVLFYAISIGMALMLLRNIIAGYKISALYQHSEKIHHKEFTEVQTQKDHLPFSFFRYIFFSAFKLDDRVRATILNHEIHHVRAKHTWDILFVEMIKVLFWWNPIVYLYKRAITENHEYAADHAAISDGSRRDYCALLLQSNMPGVNLELGHPFFQTYIKKRIDMMYRKNTNWKSYIKFVLPLIAIVCMAFIIKEDKLELDYMLDSDYIDLFAGDDLLQPEVDYILDRENNKVVIHNPNYTDKQGVNYCMFIIDEPRQLSEFEDIEKPGINNYIGVTIDANGTKSVGAKEMTDDEIFKFVDKLKSQSKEDVSIRLTIDNNVKNTYVVQFLDEAFQRNINIELQNENENDRHDIPSISPLNPQDVISNSGYGMRIHPIHKQKKMHKGLDLLAKMGTPVFATADGKVSDVKYNKTGYGKHIIIDHGNSYKTLYAHLSECNVTKNTEVKQGQQIGLVGNSGVSVSPHLHYEVLFDDKNVDPIHYGALPNEKARFYRELGNAAENMFGVKEVLNQYEAKDSIIKLGYNVDMGVEVKSGGTLLRAGEDYLLDYQLGQLKIINESYLDQPITVSFSSSEPDQFLNLYEKDLNTEESVASDMTFDNDCKHNNGVYFWTDKMPNLPSCNEADHYEDYTCTRIKLNEYVKSNLEYPESLVQLGFVGRLFYALTIDENGNVIGYEEQIRKHKKVKLPELVAEGERLMELIKENKKFEPAECNGEKVKGRMHMSISFDLNAEQMKRVERKDVSNTPNTNQIATLTGISKGSLGFSYQSEMNVPYTVIITDPLGEVIYNETFDFMYKSKRGGVEVSNNVNGEYKIEVTQDGKSVSSKMNVTIF